MPSPPIREQPWKSPSWTLKLDTEVNYVHWKKFWCKRNETRIHNYFVPKQALNHLAKLDNQLRKKTCLAKCLAFPWGNKWLCVQIPLESLYLQIFFLSWPNSSLTFRQSVFWWRYIFLLQYQFFLEESFERLKRWQIITFVWYSS